MAWAGFLPFPPTPPVVPWRAPTLSSIFTSPLSFLPPFPTRIMRKACVHLFHLRKIDLCRKPRDCKDAENAMQLTMCEKDYLHWEENETRSELTGRFSLRVSSSHQTGILLAARDSSAQHNIAFSSCCQVIFQKLISPVFLDHYLLRRWETRKESEAKDMSV